MVTAGSKYLTIGEVCRPMTQNLQGKRVAILVDNGFEQVEMTEPRKALEQAGARTDLGSPSPGKVKGWTLTR